ncbi:glycosyl transferase [Bacteroidia bacterium]|nr:glycosyl transferase [Bacteroidia bacterium]GHV42909.1 glycosyl transferase [Bacteroidia bacterium]
MKIAVNASALVKNKLTGTGWFSYQILKRITQENLYDEFIFFFDRKIEAEFVFSPNVRAVRLAPKTFNSFFTWIFFQISLRFALRKYKPDVFFSPESHICLGTKVKSINVFHDIFFEKHPQYLDNKLKLYFLRRYFPKYAKKADKIATVSEHSKKDLVEIYKLNPEKIVVVYNGADENYHQISDLDKYQIRLQYTGGKQFFVYVGDIFTKKNVVNLLKAFEIFKKTDDTEMKLMLVGCSLNKKYGFTKFFKGLKQQNNIVVIPQLEPEQLNKVLASSVALIYPSLYEGFGLPILEAFHSETAVVSSDISSMPEVAGNAALYCNPFEPADIAKQMQKIVSMPGLREKLVDAGRKQREKFSWDKTAKKLWDLLRC